jgi:hypothetical protein
VQIARRRAATGIADRHSGLDPVPETGGTVAATFDAERDEMSTDYAEAFSPRLGAAPGRRVGRWGTAARVIVGAALIVFAVWPARATGLELAIGLIVLPAVATLLVSARRRSAPPLRLGAAGHLVTLGHVAVAVTFVPEAAALFYGSMALVSGLRGTPGCEITAVANWLRGRDDQIGCPLFAPFDAVDQRARRRTSPA